MTEFFYWFGVVTFAWMACGLTAFLVAAISQWWSGDDIDGEWILGFLICLGAGPIAVVMMLIDFHRNFRNRRKLRI